MQCSEVRLAVKSPCTCHDRALIRQVSVQALDSASIPPYNGPEYHSTDVVAPIRVVEDIAAVHLGRKRNYACIYFIKIVILCPWKYWAFLSLFPERSVRKGLFRAVSLSLEQISFIYTKATCEYAITNLSLFDSTLI